MRREWKARHRRWRIARASASGIEALAAFGVPREGRERSRASVCRNRSSRRPGAPAPPAAEGGEPIATGTGASIGEQAERAKWTTPRWRARAMNRGPATSDSQLVVAAAQVPAIHSPMSARVFACVFELGEVVEEV